MPKNALEETIAQIHKDFGKGSLRVMSDHYAAEPVGVISTKCAAIDEITGIGGLPKGRVSEVYGGEAAGKTTLLLQLVAQAQQDGGIVAFIDAEQALNIDYARALGVDVDSMLISQEEVGEQALQIVEMLTKSGGISLIVVDSVDALVPRAEHEGEMGDSNMGVKGRMMSQAMHKLVSAVNKTDTCLIFANQLRDKLGVTFGNPETTSGGRALKFYASMRIEMKRISQIKKGENIIGQNVKVKIIKNKLSTPYRSAEIELYYGKGFANGE